jgi:hypothetical protein
MKTPFKSLVLIVLLSQLAGCGGGLNCPFDPPECCYNQLFGCGPFDLPFGCECSAYGLARSGAVSAAKARSKEGGWLGELTRMASSCPGSPQRVKGYLEIKARRRAISVRVPGYGTLRGIRRGGRYHVKGSYAPVTPTCSAKVRALFESRSDLAASLTVRVGYGCGGVELCSARYTGTIERR